MIINNTIVRNRRETLFCVDTGKVKIGCAYIPPPMTMHDDELLIQGALLAAREQRRWSKETFLGIYLFFCFIATLIIYLYE